MYPRCPSCNIEIDELHFDSKDAYKINLKWNPETEEWEEKNERLGWEENIRCPYCGADLTDIVSVMGEYMWISKHITKNS